MSIASKLEKLETDIENSYDAVNDMGGTLPQDKNTNNLETAIRSIPAGGGTEILNGLLYSSKRQEYWASTTTTTIDTRVAQSSISSEYTIFISN